ncbi:MAG: hypothetical protein ACYTG4_03545 [Planctomycetota bacterium]|jgi:hypothetical protein
MSFNDWFTPEGDAAQINEEELRREERRLAIQEEQAVARLQALLEEGEEAFRQGAESPSLAVRRILARRFASAREEQDDLERRILGIGKDLVTIRSVLAIVADGKKVPTLGDRQEELKVAYEDEKVGEQAYREAIGRALGLAAPEHDPVADVFRIWRGLDAGEYADVETARRALDGAASNGASRGKRKSSKSSRK